MLGRLKVPPEGLRLKHQANGNSIKLYDKQGSVLRVATSLNRPHQFRGRSRQRTRSGGEEALASVRTGQSAGSVARAGRRPVVKAGRRHRGLNPWAEPDAARLTVLSRGEWTVSGFRNRDVRAALDPGNADAAEQRRQCGRVPRALAHLRAHGLNKNVSGSYRPQLTREGRQIVTALLAARQADVEKLMALAA